MCVYIGTYKYLLNIAENSEEKLRSVCKVMAIKP